MEEARDRLPGRLKSRLFGIVPLVGFLLAGSSGLRAEDAETPYLTKPMRYDEDYRYLADPGRRNDLWDPLKFISLSPSGETYLSISGEWRERFEYTNNPNYGLTGVNGDAVLLDRLMLSGDLHAGQHFRAFLQLGAYWEHERDGGALPTDENKLDLQQGFVDFSGSTGANQHATLRLGRQEITYGSGRFIAVREGPNARRSFDGVRAMFRAPDFDLDVFATRPVELDRGSFNDKSDPDQAFWGAYGVARLSATANIDLYYFGLDRDGAVYASGTGHERRHTIGARFWGNSGPFDYNVETAYQFGDFAGRNIGAWAIASDFGWTVDDLPFKPRFGLKANIESGDSDPGDGRLGTFNPLFPNHAYFSEAAIGAPMNDMDIQANITLQLAERLTLLVGWDFFWRESRQDAVYTGALFPVPGTEGEGSLYVGNIVTAHARWRPDRHLEFNLEYTRFNAGDTIRKAGGDDVDFVMASVAYRF